VQLLFADIVVSFTFEIRVGFRCLFLHCAMPLLFYTASIETVVFAVVLAAAPAAVSYLYPVGTQIQIQIQGQTQIQMEYPHILTFTRIYVYWRASISISFPLLQNFSY